MFVATPSRRKPSVRWATPVRFALLWLAFLWAITRPVGLYRGLWRFASVSDLLNIFKASFIGMVAIMD